MWAIARYDLSLSWQEFEDLTPAMFQALCIRRNIRIKYDRFANAQTAAAVYNVNRGSEDAPIVTAFDFVRDVNPEREQEKRIKHLIRTVIGQLPTGTPREKMLDIRTRTIASLLRQGREDAEELFDSCWPSLKG